MSAPRRRHRTVILWLARIWLALAVASLWGRPLYLAAGSPGPEWLRVPWGRATRFVETPDGLVFVWLVTFGRVEVYDTDGRFVRSHPRPTGDGSAEWAVSADGRLFMRWAPKHEDVWVIAAMDSRLNVLSESRVGYGESVMLADGGGVTVHPSRGRAAAARAVRPGELLFGKRASGILEGPARFTVPDGGVLRRDALGLVRTSPDGRRTHIRCHALLWPLVLPLPGLLALIALLLPRVPGLAPRSALEAADDRRAPFIGFGVAVGAAAAPLLLGSLLARLVGLAGCAIGAAVAWSVASGRTKVEGVDPPMMPSAASSEARDADSGDDRG